MIFLLLTAAAAATNAPAAPALVATAPQLIAGAEHAVHAGRLNQATLMVARAVGAGGSGPQLDRVLADIAYGSGKYAEALARYAALMKVVTPDASMLEAAGIAALKLDDVDRASGLLSRATAARGASWRAWNALGVVADMRLDWTTADECFAQAARLAPQEAGPVNNHGWSLLLRGNWKGALAAFEQAALLDPKSARTANNLELARAALASDLPGRQPGESEASWSARLNDAGIAAAILGDKERATAAFTQALDVSGTWYARAANNLEAYGGR